MLLKLEFFGPALCMAVALSMAGCAAGRQTAAPVTLAKTAPVPVMTPSKPVPAPVPAPEPPQDTLVPMLAYADQARAMQGSELAQEIARLNDASAPDDQLRLAIALTQTRQLYDLVRAQELLQRVLANASSSARNLHALARLLAARFTELRRVEDQLDRQNQQLRDLQRRLDQTNDKLEALKEIERSLTSRPGASSAASPSRGRAKPATP